MSISSDERARLVCRAMEIDSADQVVEDGLAREFDRVRAEAFEEASRLIENVRSRIWTPDECAMAVRGIDHPPECPCHRWIDCRKIPS